MLVGVLSGCADRPPEDAEVDARVYVEAFCAEFCDKYDTCSPVPESWGTCDFEECVEWNLVDFSEDPCPAEWIEFNRCRYERLSCEEHFDMDIDTRPGSVCSEQVDDLVLCEAMHQDASGGG